MLSSMLMHQNSQHGRQQCDEQAGGCGSLVHPTCGGCRVVGCCSRLPGKAKGDMRAPLSSECDEDLVLCCCCCSHCWLSSLCKNTTLMSPPAQGQQLTRQNHNANVTTRAVSTFQTCCSRTFTQQAPIREQLACTNGGRWQCAASSGTPGSLSMCAGRRLMG